MPGDKIFINETHRRSVIKGLVWRLLASLATFVIVFLFTKDKLVAVEISGIEVIAKLLLYYGHERIWNLIKWGRSSQVMEQKI